MKKVADPVCGLVDLNLVEKVAGDAELSVRVDKVDDPSVTGEKAYTCEVRNEETHTSFLQILVAPEADPKAKEAELADAAKSLTYGKESVTTYNNDVGVGYGTTFEGGMWQNGAQVSVVRGSRSYDVVVHHWKDATPDERRKLAEDMVGNIEQNLAADSKTDSSARLESRVDDGSNVVAGGTASNLSRRLG
ncbi:hypothetical protein ABTZ46_19900 [Nocardioides sp. NPDC126508]